MQVEKVKITVAVAREWLEHVPSSQRVLDQSHVDKIAFAISRGEWRENGATIVFNSNGELIDGQHRLHAIVKAGRSVYSLVVNRLDCSDATFQTIDDAKARTIGDFLKCGNRTAMAAVARMHWIVQNELPVISQKRPPIADAIKLILPHISTIEPRIPMIAKAGRVTGIGTFLIFLDFHYGTFLQVSSTERDEFFGRLADGIDLKAGSPIAALRNRCIKLGPNEQIPRLSMMALVIKALNAFLSGETLQRLSYDPGKESFPDMAFTKKRRSVA